MPLPDSHCTQKLPLFSLIFFILAYSLIFGMLRCCFVAGLGIKFFPHWFQCLIFYSHGWMNCLFSFAMAMGQISDQMQIMGLDGSWLKRFEDGLFWFFDGLIIKSGISCLGNEVTILNFSATDNEVWAAKGSYGFLVEASFFVVWFLD